MPTVQQVILNLLSGIDDPAMRMDVARTLMFLASVYASGRAPEEEIEKSVYEVVYTVVKLKNPGLDPKELRQMAARMTAEVMDAFRAQALFSRVAARIGF